MKLGLLKESSGEKRVALLPEAVKTLTKKKVEVLVETNAGESAFASDAMYVNAGAKITSRAEVLQDSELIVIIHPLKVEELKVIGKGKSLLGAFNPLVNKEVVMSFKEAGLTTFSLDVIPRTSRAQSMDILSSMATVAGYKAVLLSANLLPHFFPMFMTAAGTIRPAKMLILGAGVAGLQAVATGRKLGSVVEVFDVRSAVKEEVKSLGGKFIEVEGAREDASAGGYAVEQTEEFKAKQRQLIHDHASKSNVIICTAQIPGRKAPLLITKETVEAMEPGSVIIDLAASSGGNCEVTQDDKTIVHNQVTIVGNSSLPTDMPSDASKMYGQNMLNFMKLIITDDGALNLNFEDDLVSGTCVTRDSEVINNRVKEFLNL